MSNTYLLNTLRDNFDRFLAASFLMLVFLCCHAFGQTPPVITNLAPSTNSVFINWKESGIYPSPNGRNGYFVITYSSVYGTASVQTANTLLNGKNITGLVPNTSYTFVVTFVVPSTGQSLASSSSSATTGGAIVIGTPFPTPVTTPAPFPTPTPSGIPTPTPVVTPTPTPGGPQGLNPPSMPNSPPSYVTNCPNLAFSDTFNEGPNFQAEMSEWGPIVPPIKWIANKADGLDFGGYYQQYMMDSLMRRHRDILSW